MDNMKVTVLMTVKIEIDEDVYRFEKSPTCKHAELFCNDTLINEYVDYSGSNAEYFKQECIAHLKMLLVSAV